MRDELPEYVGGIVIARRSYAVACPGIAFRLPIEHPLRAHAGGRIEHRDFGWRAAAVDQKRADATPNLVEIGFRVASARVQCTVIAEEFFVRRFPEDESPAAVKQLMPDAMRPFGLEPERCRDDAHLGVER